MKQPRFLRSITYTGGSGLWFVFHDDKLVLVRDGDGARLPRENDLPDLANDADAASMLGYLDGVPCLAHASAHSTLAAETELVDLRQAYGLLPELEYAIAGFASQVLHWDRTSRFCPVCGHATEHMSGERAKRCPSCNFAQYPRVSPAIIVLIYRPGQILLTRQPSWPANRYSLVAGFVEAGESLEECLRREVMEEVGVAVDEIRYLGSQPWPFPHQLMVGFLARHHSGDVAFDDHELEHAAWFDLDALPDLPPPLSISRRILDWHLTTQRDPTLPFPPFDSLAP